MFVWFDGFWILSAWTSTVDHQLVCFRMIHQIIWSYDSMIRLWLMLIHNRLMLLLWQVPTGPELYDMYSSKWSRLLPAREQDLLYMHLWVTLDKESIDRRLVWLHRTSQDWTGLHRTALNSLNSELLILPKLLSLHFIGMQISDDEFLFDIDLILNHDWWWFIKDGSENRIVNVESPSLTFKTKWSLKHVSMMLRLDRKKEIEFPVGNGEHRAGAADTDAAGFIWDLTNSVTFSCWKADCHKEHLPCLLRGHRLWHTAKQRNLAWNCLFFICFDYAFVVRLYDSSIIRIMNHESLSWFPRHWYSRVAES